MNIEVNSLGKRYRFDWIFRELSFVFDSSERYGIRGSNGAGKSTLIKLISGFLTPSKGSIVYTDQNKKINRDLIHKHVSIAAPSIELIEEYTLVEALKFQQQFKPFQKGLTIDDMIDLFGYKKVGGKSIQDFSSGMLQRLKLILAICAESSILLLDEPTSNLDEEGKIWFANLLKRFDQDRLIVIASNEEADFIGCTKFVNIGDYKS